MAWHLVKHRDSFTSPSSFQYYPPIHLRLGLQSGLFPLSLLAKIFHVYVISPAYKSYETHYAVFSSLLLLRPSWFQIFSTPCFETA